MATRTDFSVEQWQALRNAPHLVALATAAAGHSGLLGSLAEGMAMASTMAEALHGEHPLLKELFTKDEMRAAQDQINGMLKSTRDRTALNAALQKAATDATSTALAALSTKGVTAEAAAYRAMLARIGDKVANASKEGGFLGIGGERVSEGERQFLTQLNALLGTNLA